MTKRLWTLINPSDPITFRATPEEAATMAFALGRALMFVQDAETGEDAAVDRDQTIFKAIRADHERLSSLADAWGSFLIGSKTDRMLFEEAVAIMTPEQAAAYRAKYQDTKRTSMNDICAQADEVAAAFRKQVAAMTAEAA